MKKCLLALALAFFAPLFLLAQKGTIAGKLTDKTTGEELIGVSIRAESPAGIAGGLSDIEGNFNFVAEPSTYKITFTYTSFQTASVEAEVKKGEVTYVNFAMEEATGQVAEVVITYTIEKSGNLALLTARKAAAQVSDGISAESIRRTPDRTTSDVLKRVTGASIQDNRFAVIRGMNDRYNAGYLDGALLPSTESDRKAFAFDAVPANLIDNLQIIKAGTPDLIGDFGGGIIKINTKAVPETFSQSVNIGGQWHSLTTFKGFEAFKKYGGERLGLVGSERDLPAFRDGDLTLASTFATSEERLRNADITKTFNNDWTKNVGDAMPNARFGYSFGMPIRLADGKKMGLLFAANYASTRRFSEGSINSFDGSGQTSKFNDNIFLHNTTSGGLLNLNYVSTKTQVNFRNLLNLNTDNNVVLRTGTANIQDAVEVRNTANLINSNRLYSGVFSVKQVVGDKLFDVTATANFSSIRRRIPDYRIVSYVITPDFENYILGFGEFFNTSTGRFSSDLNESVLGGNLEFSKPFGQKKVKTEVRAGAFYQRRDRSFAGRSFVYGGQQSAELKYDLGSDLGVEKVGPSGIYLVEKTADDLGYYEGKSDISAFFVSADQKFSDKLRAVWGVRREDADIRVTNEKIGSKVAEIKEGAWLPSVNLTYSLGEKANVRGAYYASVNRPEFRELAPFAFYVFDKNADIRGNVDLQIARLNNFDFRLEFFPQGNQVISVGGFYKTIQNPVEFSLDVTQVTTTFTYQNEKSATIFGAEIEGRKKLDFIGKAKFFSDLTVFSNLALIKSELTFEDGSQAKQGRPLQGQSPYVLNAGLQYDNNEKGWFASAVFNQIGRRVAFAGVDPTFGDTRQDIYEAPRGVFDFQVGKNIGKLNLKLTIGDLLKQKLTYYQDADSDGKFTESGDRLMFQFTNGNTATLSAGYTF